MTYPQLFFAICSLIIALGGTLFTWKRWRESQLRRDEVLSWADDCIECLQTLFIISSVKISPLTKEKVDEIRLKIIFDTSSLIERGRLFFKNEVVDNFGSDKQPAYRGYRPRILDHLVAAHQIALHWPSSNDDEILDRTAIAADCVRSFVSLAQMEVGRQRAASVEAIMGGDGINLTNLMSVAHSRRNQSPIA